MAIHPNTPVSALPGVGVASGIDLKNLGITSVRDLLFHFPFRYDDFSSSPPIPKLRHDDLVTIVGRLRSLSTRPAKNRKMKITEGIIENETGELKVMWFNQPYLERA